MLCARLREQIAELSQRLEQAEAAHRAAIADLTANFQRQREQDVARCVRRERLRTVPTLTVVAYGCCLTQL